MLCQRRKLSVDHRLYVVGRHVGAGNDADCPIAIDQGGQAPAGQRQGGGTKITRDPVVADDML